MTSRRETSELAEIQSQYKELKNLGDDIEGSEARLRGGSFEKLINRVFRLRNLHVRSSYHTSDNKSEQIDGAISFDSRYVLVECKWEKKNLAASSLFAFIGKVESKFQGTTGLFISKNQLSENFIKALSYGRKRNILVMHGEDVDCLFEPEFPLTEYLSAYLKMVSVDNIDHLVAKEFWRVFRRDASTSSTDNEGRQKKKPELIQFCLQDNRARNVLFQQVRKLKAQEAERILEVVFDDYADYLPTGINSKEAEVSSNLISLVQEAVKQLPESRSAIDSKYFMELLSMDFGDQRFSAFVGDFSPRFSYLENDEQRYFEERFFHRWNEVYGTYDDENLLAPVTEALFEGFSSKAKKKILQVCIDLAISYRYDSYPQMKMARRLLEASVDANLLKRALIRHLHAKLRQWENVEFLEEEEFEDKVKRHRFDYKKLNRYFADLDAVLRKGLKEWEKRNSSE